MWANEWSNWDHKRDCLISCIIPFIWHNALTAVWSSASTASRGQAMCSRIPKRAREEFVRCQGGNRCWRGAIFRCTVTKDCDVTTFTRKLSKINGIVLYLRQTKPKCQKDSCPRRLIRYENEKKKSKYSVSYLFVKDDFLVRIFWAKHMICN